MSVGRHGASRAAHLPLPHVYIAKLGIPGGVLLATLALRLRLSFCRLCCLHADSIFTGS